MAKTSAPLSQDLLVLGPLPARGIMQATCEKYSYYKATYSGKPVQVACYTNSANEVLFQKIRGKDKDFFSLGKTHKVFYGQHLYNSGKKLIVTEGEIDCLTVSQLQDNKWPVVSLPFGAGSAAETFKENLDWLEGFEEVITMFDMDKAGEEARKSVEGLLSPGKLYHATLPLKDPNECLVKGQGEAVKKAIWNAKQYKPGGIVNGADLWDRLNDHKKNTHEIPWPWPGIPLQNLTRGIRKGEMIMLTAGTGIGKSTVFREMAYWMGVKLDPPMKIGMVFLEEQNEETGLALMSLHENKRLHLEWESISAEERRKSFEETLGTGRFVFYDHFGSIDGESLLNRIRYMVTAEGCDFIFLDHVSIAISGLATNNERKDIDVLMTNLASLIQETGCGMGIICHLKKTEGQKKSFEQGAQISLDDLRGSGTLKQIPNTIVAGERDQQTEDDRAKNLFAIRLLKCRFTGKTGPAGYLWFNEETGRLDLIDDKDAFLGTLEVSSNGDLGVPSEF
jgi:twinkle protein